MTLDELLGVAPFDPGAPASPEADPVPPYPNEPLALAKIGIRLRDQGFQEPAEGVFRRLTTEFPHLVFGWQELAILQSQRGDHEQALELFRKALEVAPADLLTRKHAAFHLLRIGRPDAAKAVITAHPRGDRDIDSALRVLFQFVDFVAEYPEALALALVGRFEQSGSYLAPAQVEQRIIAAAETGSPFSLIRLGDGEGAWLALSPEDEARFSDLYERNRRSFLNSWFASERAYESRSFVALRNRLAAAVGRADVIGIPYGLRVASEYRIPSVRGVPSCVNILRSLIARLEAKTGNYCAQDIHLDLHLGGFFQRLFAMPFTLGIVSCYPTLGYRMASALGARVSRSIIVPEEKGASQLAGVSGMCEAHYPVVFWRNLERLRQHARKVRIWLIAAGYLGKVYCDEIRQAGGVAIDIGSIVDGWSGKVTRPTLRAIDRFALRAGSP